MRSCISCFGAGLPQDRFGAAGGFQERLVRRDHPAVAVQHHDLVVDAVQDRLEVAAMGFLRLNRVRQVIGHPVDLRRQERELPHRTDGHSGAEVPSDDSPARAHHRAKRPPRAPRAGSPSRARETLRENGTPIRRSARMTPAVRRTVSRSRNRIAGPEPVSITCILVPGRGHRVISRSAEREEPGSMRNRRARAPRRASRRALEGSPRARA